MFFNKLNLTILGLGLVLAPFMPGYAHAASSYTAIEKQEALLFVSEQLGTLADDDATLGYFIDAQEAILSDEADGSMVRDMANTYRQQIAFNKAFIPTHKLFFERDGIWHIMEMNGTIVIRERCYRQNNIQVACN